MWSLFQNLSINLCEGSWSCDMLLCDDILCTLFHISQNFSQKLHVNWFPHVWESENFPANCTHVCCINKHHLMTDTPQKLATLKCWFCNLLYTQYSFCLHGFGQAWLIVYYMYWLILLKSLKIICDVTFIFCFISSFLLQTSRNFL